MVIPDAQLSKLSSWTFTFCSYLLSTGRPSNRLGRQPWALSLPDKELCLREALAVWECYSSWGHK